jgi:hypothetical protein
MPAAGAIGCLAGHGAESFNEAGEHWGVIGLV